MTSPHNHTLAAAQIDRNEAIRVLRQGLGKGLQEAAALYSIPVCWIAAEKG